jgi:transposase
VLKLLKKRLFSSPAAFATTLEQHQRSLQSAKRRGSSGISKPTVGILRRQLEQVEEEFADDTVYEESTEDAIANTTRLFREVAPKEKVLLDEMQTWANQAVRRPDYFHWQ